MRKKKLYACVIRAEPPIPVNNDLWFCTLKTPQLSVDLSRRIKQSYHSVLYNNWLISWQLYQMLFSASLITTIVCSFSNYLSE